MYFITSAHLQKKRVIKDYTLTCISGLGSILARSMAFGAGSAIAEAICSSLRFEHVGGIFLVGATLCVHPLDVVRVNMQLDGEGRSVPRYQRGLYTSVPHTGDIMARHVSSFRNCVSEIGKAPHGLYRGLTAGIFRQLTYTLPQLMVYSRLVHNKKGQNLSFVDRLGIGCVSGGVGALASVPSEVVLVRMAAESRSPLYQRSERTYRNVFNGLTRIAKKEGVTALWKGTFPTISRACLFHAAQLGVYPQAKKSLHATCGLTGTSLQVCSSLVSGVAAVALSCPADVIKTRIQHSLARDQYAGMRDCFRKTVNGEGVRALWKGSVPSVARVLPQSVISFFVLEKMFSWYSGEEAFGG